MTINFKYILSCYLCNSYRGLEQILPFYRGDNQELSDFSIVVRLQTAKSNIHILVFISTSSLVVFPVLFSNSVFQISYHNYLDIGEVLFFLFNLYSKSSMQKKVRIVASVLI